MSIPSGGQRNPAHYMQQDTYRRDEMNQAAARGRENEDVAAHLDETRDAKQPWYRRFFRRKPPLPYV